MSLFGDLDVESAEANPWFKPDGTYTCALTEIKVAPTKNGDKVGMTLVFKITEGPKKGRTISPWMWIPTVNQIKSPDEDEAEKASSAVGRLKERMLSMGVPADKINNLDAQDLMDLDQLYLVTIRNKNGSENVNAVAVAGEGEVNPFGN